MDTSDPRHCGFAVAAQFYRNQVCVLAKTPANRFVEFVCVLEQDIEGVVVGPAQTDAYTTTLREEFIRVSGNGLRDRTTVSGERSV